MKTRTKKILHLLQPPRAPESNRTSLSDLPIEIALESNLLSHLPQNSQASSSADSIANAPEPSLIQDLPQNIQTSSSADSTNIAPDPNLIPDLPRNNQAFSSVDSKKSPPKHNQFSDLAKNHQASSSAELTKPESETNQPPEATRNIQDDSALTKTQVPSQLNVTTIGFVHCLYKMSSSEDESSAVIENEERKRKKGVINRTQYKSEVIKKAKVKGESHFNHVGKKVLARKTGINCSCRKKCCEQYSEIDKRALLTSLHDFDNKNSQDSYLQGLIEVAPIKRTRKSQNAIKRIERPNNFLFNTCLNGVRKHVCKKAFLSLYGVGEKHVRRLCHLLTSGTTPRDNRGKSIKSRHNLIPAEVCFQINEHIKLFDVKEVHYANVVKKYLPATLDVKQMHKMFIDKFPDSKLMCVLPVKNLAKKLKATLNDTAKRVAVAELMVHKNKAKKFYKKLDQIKKLSSETDEILGITMDYMQNLPIPDIPVQEIFYYRQLWVFEFSIHNLKTEEAKFYSYHEGEAYKGPNEVCTFLKHYFEHEVSENVKEVHIFSDGCAGQNKNHTVVRFLLALASSGRFNKIVHYFPIRGHSFLPCDRDFGVAKRLIRKQDRIFLPEEYYELIERSSSKSLFSIERVHNENILDFKKWWPKYYKKTVLSIDSYQKKIKDEKITFQISQYNEFEYDCRKPGIVKVRPFIDGLMFHEFSLGKPAGVCPDLPSEPAYSGKIPINFKKMDNIKKLVQYVPDDKVFFYNELILWPTTKQDESPEEDF
ncbi:unnamed protein product [Psylliodes chrysocephalus]|uniref:DUF7869 domain-containing protein n=1 Tax=Psylliodes chrysocephalus TaxID=3402493 RepID=A0A9P0GIH1_9CUCU|nr:unnamed protein product [Psylliodes chrysocephala]